MTSEQPSPRVVRFGAFEADLVTGELRKSGVRVKLEHQPFQVLRILLQRPGELVGRDDLREAIWSGDTFVDFDQSLNTAVRKLRDALGDSATKPKFIETLPRRGYRFVGAIDGIPSSDEKPRSGEGARSKRDGARVNIKRWTVAVAFVLIIATVSGGVVWWLYGRRTRTSGVWRPVPVTTYAGRETHPTLNPDASQVAFAWDGENQDNIDIYIKTLGAEVRSRLTTDPRSDFSPVWSPDGKWIAFLRNLSNENAAVYLISPLGGPERELVTIDSRLYAWGPGYLAWSVDSQWLVFPERGDSGSSSGLSAIHISTGEKHPLVRTPKGFSQDSYPAVSPDGRHLAFSRFTELLKGEIYLLDLTAGFLASGEPRRLTFTNRQNGDPFWSTDGREVFYSQRGYGIWRIPADGSGEPQRAAYFGEPAVPPGPVLSRGGNYLVYAASAGTVNLWELSLSEPGQPPFSPKPLVTSTYVDHDPHYSPDGARVAFISTRGGGRDVWVCQRDGSNLSQLTHMGGYWTFRPRWSPDGSWIAFQSSEGPTSDIYVIPAAGGSPHRLTTDPANDNTPSWSHDERSIYFSSDRTGQFQVWRKPREGGEPVRITSDGGYAPQASRDGKYVFYAKDDGEPTSIWRVEAEGGSESELVANTTGQFAVAADGIYFRRFPSPANVSEIRFVDFAGGEEPAVVQTDRLIGYELDVAPDGSSLIYSRWDQWGSDLMLVEGFK